MAYDRDTLINIGEGSVGIETITARPAGPNATRAESTDPGREGGEPGWELS